MGKRQNAIDNAIAFATLASERIPPMPTATRKPTKSSTFQLRINPDIRHQAESVFAECGLTLSQAFHLFLQQSINVGGLPFLVVRDAGKTLRHEAERRLFDAIREGEASAERDGWVAEEAVLSEFGMQP
jgi:addiction module RelB/DinJ family antitoxin